MKKFLNEFKTFISRGNVMDMAIGVVIATAFGKISASLVADIIMPLIGCLIGGVDLATRNITLKPAVMDGETVVSEAVVLGLGTFLTTIIDFLLIAFVVFLVVKAMNMAKAKLEKPAEPEREQTEAAEAAQDKRRKSLTEVLYKQIDILEREQKKIASGYEGSNNPKAARSENLAFAKQITETANAIISIKRRNTK